MIRPATSRDAKAISGIYNHYIRDTVITFEEEPVSTREMSARVKEVLSAGFPWLVAIDKGEVLGYAYASKWKGRCAYRYSVESSVYLAENSRGRGLGSLLYKSLLARLRKSKLHVVIGGIALPNKASVRLHEKFGFKKVAHFEEVGFKLGAWIDVGYWQKSL